MKTIPGSLEAVAIAHSTRAAQPNTLPVNGRKLIVRNETIRAQRIHVRVGPPEGVLWIDFVQSMPSAEYIVATTFSMRGCSLWFQPVSVTLSPSLSLAPRMSPGFTPAPANIAGKANL
jgi:hypothetical protein